MTTRDNLTARNKDYALYLPSISGFYPKTMAKSDIRVPTGFENGIEGLNFLNEDKGYFTYKWGLYSAGHAQLDIAKSNKDEAMVQGRDRSKTFIVGDSGGFQVMTGVLKQDWSKFKTDHTLRVKILDWLEHTADYSMIMDVPTLAITDNYSHKTGLTTFDECLEYTNFNTEWILKNRKGQTKFLNSMQGRFLDEAIYWYEQTKHHPFEGFGFGGSTARNLHILLNLLLRMRDDKLLEKGEHDYLHLLGVSRPEWSIYFTAIKRMLREHVNPDMELGFDAASAFISATKGSMISHSTMAKDSMSFKHIATLDDKHLSNSDDLLPWRSPIFDRLVAKDLSPYNHGVPNLEEIEKHGMTLEDVLSSPDHLNDEKFWHEMGATNLQGKIGKTSWDLTSYLVVMAHNVYHTICTLQNANALADLAYQTTSVDYEDLLTSSSKIKKLDVSPFISADVYATVKIIEDVFTSETPYSVLDKTKKHLDKSAIIRDSTTTTTFSQLFDFD